MQARLSQLESARKQASRLITVVFLLFVAVRNAQSQTPATGPQATAEHSRKIVVSIAHRKLALIEDGKVKQLYPVAVGAAESPSPTGTFEVKTRLVKPTYYHPGKVIPAGAGNPLGTRWIGLSTKGYGIHGTNVESSIGKAASHGCIRMHRKDLEQLFAQVQVGDQVEIHGEDSAEISSIFGEMPGAATTTQEVATTMVAGQ